MNNLTVYAIRHKPSGEFMPARMSRCGFGGWSWWREPNQGEPYDKTPRIFPTKTGARNALSAWLAGRWVQVIEKTGNWEEPEESDNYCVPEKTENARNRDDMEIVSFSLIENKE